eukprot:5143559-Pleurochrysis_carterae.AAC.2
MPRVPGDVGEYPGDVGLYPGEKGEALPLAGDQTAPANGDDSGPGEKAPMAGDMEGDMAGDIMLGVPKPCIGEASPNGV